MKNLLFEVSPTNFVVHRLENGARSNSWSLELSLKSENQKREQITDFLIKEGITLFDYSNSIVLWSNQSAVLAPSKLVDSSNIDSILEFSFGSDLNKGESDYNRIPILNTTLIYTIPLWLKTLFVLKFSGSKIIHVSTAVLNYLSSKNSMNKLCGSILINEDFITVILFLNDNPISFVQTKYEELDDIVYHVSYALQHIGENYSTGLIELFHFDSEKTQLVREFISRMNDLKINEKIKWENKVDFDLSLFFACV